jgi:hypothetical protein
MTQFGKTASDKAIAQNLLNFGARNCLVAKLADSAARVVRHSWQTTLTLQAIYTAWT